MTPPLPIRALGAEAIGLDLERPLRADDCARNLRLYRATIGGDVPPWPHLGRGRTARRAAAIDRPLIWRNGARVHRLGSPAAAVALAMTSTTAAPQHYDRRTVTLHWLTAAFVIGLWCVGQTIDFFPKGTPRITVRSLHITFGGLLGVVLAYRIWWRASAGVRLPPAGAGRLDALASVVHKLLYLLLISTVLLGLANTWVRGDTLFGLLKIPAFAPGNDELRETVEDWHGLSANLLIGLAGLHAAAGLLHHYVFKDAVLRRMLPRR